MGTSFTSLQAMQSKVTDGNLSKLEQSILAFGVNPDVISDNTANVLNVTFKSPNNNTIAINKPGQEISPLDSSLTPEISFNGEDNKVYTLMMIDPDPPSRSLPILKDIVHWMIVNIQGNNIKEGTLLAKYKGPGIHIYNL